MLPSSASSEFALRPQRLAKLPQQERRRYANSQRDETQHTVSPTETKCIVQIRREQWEAESAERSQYHCRRERRSRIPRVAIYDVRLHALEDDDGAGGIDDSADVGEDPVLVGLGCPAVPILTSLISLRGIQRLRPWILAYQNKPIGMMRLPGTINGMRNSGRPTPLLRFLKRR